MSNNGNNAKRATIGGVIDNDNANLLDKFFEIPPYQRLYEWEKEQIETLLDDIKKACGLDKKDEKVENKKEYFIGTITISAETNEKEQGKENNDKNKVYKLIDGQQRLTTIWFIGFYLASNEKCGEWQKKWQEFIMQSDKLRIAMPIRDNEQNSLTNLAKKIVDGKHKFEQDKDGKVNLFKELQNIHQKIISAFLCIESWFNENFSKDDSKKEIDFERLNCFANFIYTKVCFVFVTLAENTDLNRFFVRMNNRGKQLEKHEILKARILDKIKDDKSDEWQKYAKIWDLCSDMDKYIFQSVSDRNIFGNPKDKTGQDNSGQSIDEIINNPSTDSNNNAHKDDDNPKKVESIIDFPTFLLHCYKLWVTKKCSENEIPKAITITKDKLLEIMWDAKDERNKHDYLLIKCGKQDCKEFIIDMLRYRVLFDYFVIKNDTNIKQSNTFRIRRLKSYQSGKNTYYRLPDDSKSVGDNSPLKALATLQNYLRIARQGERQNYHHWLTPFLKFLDNHICLDMILALDGTKEFDFDNFKDNAEKIAKQFSVANKCDGQEKVLINFLENLDTKLAIKQLSKTNENVLLNTANIILININEHLNFQEEKSKIEQISKWQQQYNIFFKNKCFINNGTGTPHYWFYRLEYYLWKWGTLDETKFKEKFRDNFDNLKLIFSAKLGEHDFKSIAKSFYFRNLNSIEHFHPQHLKEQNGWETYIDYFGNLALISNSTNSQYSDQLPKEKKEDLKNKLNKKGGNIESLKFFLMCAQCEQDMNEWVYDNNVKDKHQNEMIGILIKSLNSKSK